MPSEIGRVTHTEEFKKFEGEKESLKLFQYLGFSADTMEELEAQVTDLGVIFVPEAVIRSDAT